MAVSFSPPVYVNSGDAERVTKILKNIDDASGAMRGGGHSTDGPYWYWRGYLDCFCEQKAISDEARELLAAKLKKDV